MRMSLDGPLIFIDQFVFGFGAVFLMFLWILEMFTTGLSQAVLIHF